MPGKAYTMREMKRIVEYLVENKYYDEVRGRKMWTDFANSRVMDRTWQSLKETFLKRILPDIHNPYYKLTVPQIASFRQGYDIEAKNKAKLEIQTVSDADESSGSGSKEKNIQHPSTSKNNKEKTTGEKGSKALTNDRFSTETLVLENCYETAEDILRELDPENEDKTKEETNKNEKTTLRDLLTYSEPLTPMIQEVLHDFATDDEDEPPMQIVEENEVPSTNEEKNDSHQDISPGIRESPSLAATKPVVKSTEETKADTSKENNDQLEALQHSKIKSLKLKKTQKGTWENKSGKLNANSLHQENTTSEKNNNMSSTIADSNGKDNNVIIVSSEHIKADTEEPLTNSGKNEKTTQNSSDTLLPNNQEALNNDHTEKRTTNEGSTSELQSLEKIGLQKATPTRKRSCSLVSTEPKRKLRKDTVTEINSDLLEKEELGKQHEIYTVEANNIDDAKKNTENKTKSPTVNDQQGTNKNAEAMIVHPLEINIGENHNSLKESNSQEAGPSGITKKQKDTSEINPCLKSVSLYAEQFCASQYSDSEIRDREVAASDKTEKKTKKDTQDIELNTYENPKPTKIKAQQKEGKRSETNTSKGTKENEDVTIDNQHQKEAQQKSNKNEAQQKEGKRSETNTSKGTKENKDVTIDNQHQKEAQQKSNKNKGNTDKVKQNLVTKAEITRDINEVIILKSHSESETNLFQPSIKKNDKKKLCNGSVMSKTQRDNALANVFGFTSGGTTRKRTYSYRDRTSRRYSQRKRTSSRHSNNVIDFSLNSGSSDDTTGATDSDDPSPPHGTARHRNNLKYIKKPEAFDIFTDPEGCLFTIVGRKMYPIVSRGGRRVNNYVMASESDDEEAENYWKSKYLDEKRKNAEEKIRADELARLLQRAVQQAGPEEAPPSPVLQPNPSLNYSSVNNQPKQSVAVMAPGREHKAQSNDIVNVESTAEPKKQETFLKIKINKDNEIEMVCQWPFRTKVENKTEDNPNLAVASGTSTPVVTMPVDPEVREKMNKLESEIFKEIEDRDNRLAEPPQPDANVNKRKRGRPMIAEENSKTLSVGDVLVSTEIPTKRTSSQGSGTASDASKKDTVKGKTSRVNEVQSDTASGVAKRLTRTPKRFASDAVVPNEGRKTRSSSRNTSKSSSSKQDKVEIPEDDEVLYKLPSEEPGTRPASARNSDVNTRQSSRSYEKKTSRKLSPDNSSVNSIESSFGYQDSDVSLSTIGSLRKKRKLTLSTILYRGRRARSSIAKKFEPYLADDDTRGGNPTSNLLQKSVHVPNSSLDTEVYRSESYQLMFPKRRHSLRQLDRINETSAAQEVISPTLSSNISPITVNIDNVEGNVTKKKDSNSLKHDRNSSNVSLPPSPELSIVENISVCKDMLTGSTDEPTINETQCNDASERDTDSNKYFISEVDVSVPLMEQNCELQKTRPSNIIKRKRQKAVTKTPVSDLATKISDVNIEEQSYSDSLDQKLKNLLLESAKKMAQQMQTMENEANEVNAMEVDTVTKESKKTRAKKRCSTPRKKKDKVNTKEANTEPLIEEHIESCSHGGRKSCPPVINIITCEDAVSEVTKVGNKNLETTNTRKNRKKKDVIKVKILRPRDKSLPREGSNKRIRSFSRMSACTDSGINDTESGVFVQGGDDDSVELIHNHSETCLHANECMADSVEFVDNTPKSVITVDSNSESMNDESHSNCEEFETPEMFCNNAQDATSLHTISPAVLEADSKSEGDDIAFHTPKSGGVSFNSLITEDLSEGTPAQSQPKPTKWYLLCEEETTNSTFHDSQSNDNASTGANLNHIFPITCAVPDLSTITEMSTENDSRKATLDTDVEYTENTTKSKPFRSIFDI